jgi:hypothetical protein
MSIRAVRDREQEQHEQEGQEGARAIQAPAGNGTQFTGAGPIPPVGDLSGVRAHAGPSASERGYGALGAVAYTRGQDIHVGAGPQAAAVPHEAAHVVQQAQGRVRPTAQVHEDEGLEHEADEMGARAGR